MRRGETFAPQDLLMRLRDAGQNQAQMFNERIMLTKAENASPEKQFLNCHASGYISVKQIIFERQIAATAALKSEADCIFFDSFVQDA